MKKILFGLALLSGLSYANAQNSMCAENIDFENNNFDNWHLYLGTCCVNGQLIINDFETGPISNRHLLTSGSGSDQYGGFPIVAPESGSYTLKLGNSGNGKEAERARYILDVPNGIDKYSLIIRYAIVLENPNHQAHQQPRFLISVYDSTTGTPIECSTLNYIARNNIPGFLTSKFNSNVIYKPWTPLFLDLSAYSGKKIVFEFASGDCSQGGHFGYGYVDMSCGIYTNTQYTCNNYTFTTLSGPFGYKSYEWLDENFSFLGAAKSIQVATPNHSKRYYVVVTPYDGFGCTDTLPVDLMISDLALKMTPDTMICVNSPFQLFNSASAGPLFQPLSYVWLRDTTELSCVRCLNPLTSPTQDATMYVLNVSDSKGCSITDTVWLTKKKIQLDIQPPDLIQCLSTKALFYVGTDGNTERFYQWYKNGQALIPENKITLEINPLHYSDTGFYHVKINNGCDTLQSDSVKLGISPKPQILIQPKDLASCIGMQGKLSSTSIAALHYQWYKDGIKLTNKTRDSLFFNAVQPADTGFYYLMIAGACDTIYSDTVSLTLNPPTAIISHPASVKVCEGSSASFYVKGTGSGTLSYQWFKNSTPIAGATRDSLNLFSVSQKDIAQYSVTVAAGCDIQVSKSAALSLFPKTPEVFDDSTLVCITGGWLEISGYFNYLWNTGEQTSRIPITKEGLYWVRYADSNQCTGMDTTRVIFDPLPTISAGSDTILCNEATLQLNAAIFNYYSFHWLKTEAGSFDDILRLNPIVKLKPLIGKKLIVLEAENKCGINRDTIEVELRAKLKAEFHPAKSPVCLMGDPVELIPNHTGGDFYGTYVSSQKFYPQATGTFPISYKYGSLGCIDTFTTFISVISNPVAAFSFNPDSPAVNQYIQFKSNSKNAHRILWNFHTGEQFVKSELNYAYLADGLFPVKLYAFNIACVDSIEKLIPVEFSRLWVPNAFTPGKDEINDSFKAITYNIRIGSIRIYDKWGKELYYSDDLSKGWDGNYGGKPCPADVYTYSIQYIKRGGQPDEQSGTVTLFR
ncbi:MAG: T9SS type B sorting domain-containing protein [Bacteroidia bacterium]|jgi:gliding motility-associated-like protein